MNIIFDIDGTLVQSYRLDTECFCQAATELFGTVRIRSDWDDYAHVTDEGIFREICSDNGLENTGSDQMKARFSEILNQALQGGNGVCPPVPGAVEAMQDLTARTDVRLGLATGGWQTSARLKLDHAGIPYAPSSLFASDRRPERVAIMRACHAAIADPAKPTVYVGDGEWDMAATADLGWYFIGIGPRLKGACPVWVEDFTGPGFTALLHRTGESR